MSMLQLLLRPADRRLADVLARLPNLGIGARVARKSWAPYGDSWWEVTDVKLKGPEGGEARVWGVLHWRGRRAGDAPKRIGGAAKRVWRWLPEEAEAARLAPLAAALKAQQRAQQQPQAAGGGGGE
ncbi:hypothetical protein Rsub_02322 [Raphidocelis subcapitata]|uniref:Uncharacterized protein n=1 Tax=Raphidocelis subcapitata TaxID=307507 RepID=A0A2V0NPR7_9CHLO|nr:hypothetical protein Rsub_02322 [Raphidocelis subcapitata]|eukprot:GBF89604.1 hypothetical protein Rsub_02322 [Raphidocelis subcapitata]